MPKPSYALVILFAFGCGGSDISENPPIGSYDAAAGIDSRPGIDSSSGIDSGSNDAETSEDAGDVVDASDDLDAVAAADASGDRAQVFCDRYDALCGYSDTNPQRFDDEPTCLTDFDSFDATRQDCVEDQLDQFEIDANLQHCARATGTGPCS